MDDPMTFDPGATDWDEIARKAAQPTIDALNERIAAGELVCPRDGGTLTVMTRKPQRVGRGGLSRAPEAVGWSCENGHTLDNMGERPLGH